MIESGLVNKKTIFFSLGIWTTFLGACNFEDFDKLVKLDMEYETVSTEDLVERDVEAPDVFQVSEAGFWDGRPSLGGVWVAHPDVKMPERVLIQNGENNGSVVGTLFRRERESTSPRLQVSSEAASELGLRANSPVKLTVTVLRKRMVKPNSKLTTNTTEKRIVSAVENDKTKLNTAEESAKESSSKKSVKIKKPFIQLGIFSIKQNASNTGESMQRMGFMPTIKEQKIKEKTYWRVIVGPASSLEERKALLKSIISAGFGDAYAVEY